MAINPYKTPNNSILLPQNWLKMPINWVKIQIKAYLTKYHEYPTANYISRFLNAVEVEFVRIVEQVLGYGFLAYTFLFTLLTVFPALHNFVKLGTSWNVRLLILFMLGIVVTVVKPIFEWRWRCKNGKN